MKNKLRLKLEHLSRSSPDNEMEIREDIESLKQYFDDHITRKTPIIVAGYDPSWMLKRIKLLEYNLLDFIIMEAYEEKT